MSLSFQSIRVGPAAESEEGMLVSEDGSIVAVLSRVPQGEGDLQGEWYIECGFPDELGSRHTFDQLEDAAKWIQARLDKSCLRTEAAR